VTISWNAVNTATGYEIVFNGTTCAQTGTSRTFSGLAANTEYEYRIRAKNADGYGLYSALRTVRTLSGAPDAPDTVWAEPDFNSIVVKWLKVEDALEYEVEFDGTAVAVAPAGQEGAVVAVRSTADQ